MRKFLPVSYRITEGLNMKNRIKAARRKPKQRLLWGLCAIGLVTTWLSSWEKAAADTASPGASAAVVTARSSDRAAAEALGREPRQQTPPVQASATAEFGALGFASHTIQFGKSAPKFDYVNEGGQDVLFFFSRYSLDFAFRGGHTVTFLYQPLNPETQVLLNRRIVIDELTFPKDTPLNLRYGFDFYRLSYTYNLLPEFSKHELSLGASLQMRNATITFTSADGSLRRAKRDLGPVPILKARARYTFQKQWWIGGEVDGFYAPVKYINGGSSDVEGAIVDLSARLGYDLQKFMSMFINLRYLGGGASGTSKDKDDRGDGYVSNWLHTLALSIATTFRPTSL
jgi:hypothetical protein